MSKQPIKRGRGRPPKAADDLFSESVYVRCTAEEKRAMDRAAGELGITKWARHILNRAARRARRQ